MFGFVWECFQNQCWSFYFKTGHQECPNLFQAVPNQDHVQPSLCLSLSLGSFMDAAVCLCVWEGWESGRLGHNTNITFHGRSEQVPIVNFHSLAFISTDSFEVSVVFYEAISILQASQNFS